MKLLYSIIFFLFCSTIQAQNIISLDDALAKALKNNFDIMIVCNDFEKAKIQNTAGNAGMLPTIEIIGSGNLSNNEVTQKFENNSNTTYPSFNSSNVNGGVQLSWTLFDGGKMFVTKSKLSEIQNLGELQYQVTILELTYNVIASYYDIVRQKKQLQAINELIRYTNERVLIAQTGFQSGSLAKSDYLQAKIDLNVAIENEINQKYSINEAKKHLCFLIANNCIEEFDVTDSITFDYSLDKTTLKNKLNSSNTTIQTFRKQLDIASLIIKEQEKSYIPKLEFQGGYYVSQTVNSDGNIRENKEIGPQIGGTLTIPLYNAGKTKQNNEIAKLEFQKAQYKLDNINLETNIEFDNTFEKFENQKKLLEIEQENNKLTKENLEISISRFRYGQTSSLEVHLAQETYIQSCTRIATIEYNLKLTEIKLKQLVADL